jgi:hypothetical protein
MYRSCVGSAAPIGVASGTTVENVHETLPFVDVFLVATGVEQGPTDPQEIAFYKEAGIAGVKLGHLDATRVRALGREIHEWG